MNVLVTGGCGYIGSHIVIELLNNNYDVIIIDNLSNSNINIIDKIKKITNKDVVFYDNNINDMFILNEIFSKYDIKFVIHCAGFKSVNESITKPLDYYDNNIGGTISLLYVMAKYNCKKIIFSSSATVYGIQKYPVDETCETGKNITNPYGKTKYIIEELLKDLYISDNSWSIIILRYFNPIACHESGLIGEDTGNNIPNNLFPYILRVSYGFYPELKIFGIDYDTPDGSCIRDFVHVVDLANAHVCVAKKLNENNIHIYNVATNIPTSVLTLVNTFEKVNNIKLNYNITDRRPGDIDVTYASANEIKKLGWMPKYSIEDMCMHGYNYIKKQNLL